MLTGDKGETAKNIAISCGLIKENNNAVFELSGTSKDELIEQLKNIFQNNRNPSYFDIIQTKVYKTSYDLSGTGFQNSTQELQFNKNKKDISVMISGASLPILFSKF